MLDRHVDQQTQPRRDIGRAKLLAALPAMFLASCANPLDVINPRQPSQGLKTLTPTERQVLLIETANKFKASGELTPSSNVKLETGRDFAFYYTPANGQPLPAFNYDILVSGYLASAERDDKYWLKVFGKGGDRLGASLDFIPSFSADQSRVVPESQSPRPDFVDRRVRYAKAYGIQVPDDTDWSKAHWTWVAADGTVTPRVHVRGISRAESRVIEVFENQIRVSEVPATVLGLFR